MTSDSDLPPSLGLKLGEKSLPYVFPVLFAQRFVPEDDMNARNESVIETSNPICGEEQDALVILDLAQEDLGNGSLWSVFDTVLG